MSIITVDRYTSLEIADNGQYGWSLVQGYTDKDGNFKPNFCKREFGKEKKEKKTPLSIKLGSDPVKALTELLNAIGAPTGDDVPF